jgi:hypothetical protein
MPVLTAAFLLPRSGPKSVSTRFWQRKECLYRSRDAVFHDFPHCKTILRASPVSIPYNRRYSLGLLFNTVSFQNT